MNCRICGEDINEKGQDNISPIIGYPVCEDCKDDIECEECYSSDNLCYVEELDKILCEDCIIELAERMGHIHTVTEYYTDEYTKISDETDKKSVIDYLHENCYFGIERVQEE